MKTMASPAALPRVLLAVCVVLTTQLMRASSHTPPSYKEHLSTAETIMKAVRTPGDGRFSELRSAWPHLFSPSRFQEALWTAVDQLSGNGTFLERLSASPDVSPLCSQHLEQLLLALFNRNYSALQMIDAMGKPSPGMLLFNLLWPGELKECENVTFMNRSSPQQPLFTGEYCTAHITLAKKTKEIPMPFAVSTGICVPNSCTSLDISILLNEMLEVLKIRLPASPYAVCQEDGGSRPLDGLAIGGIVVAAVFVALMVVGTVMDLAYRLAPRWRKEEVETLGSNRHHDDLITFHVNQCDDVRLLGSPPSVVCQPGMLSKVLMAFSVYTNGAKLLSTDQAAGTLDCVHGIRFLSMTWVVLGHTFLFPLFASSNLIGYISEAIQRWTFQAIINASVSVDTFFVLSGLLVAYLSLKELKRNAGSPNWLKFFLKFYIHRYWRLTPPYMLIIFIYLSLGRYWGSGPLWPSSNTDRDSCQTSWWANMLYINNFVNLDKQCLGQSWYLANDMQFYVLSPLIFVPLYFSPIYGGVSALVFLLASIVPPAAITMREELTSSLTGGGGGNNNNNYFDDYYIKPYNRMGPYIIGMLTGYFLFRTNCKVKISKVVNLLCWAAATATALAVLYGLYEQNQGHPLTRPLQAFYNAMARPAWGASVAWVIFACVTGNGGFVNTILSWKALIPLSRLTYCIYLLHIMILTTYIFSRDTTFYFSDANVVVLFLGLLVVCYMVSAVVSLAFEAPMMALEKLLKNQAGVLLGSQQTAVIQGSHHQNQ
ncbi:nose resistant to fluoxetine protein 6-like [Babylonia areolata]|uniref:nose resistant to fluoxetine protein 6-like n=1 Tax=Babylonia areolata TaxID=304850 RepID=UPI003FD08915